MFLLSARCSFSCLLIIALTGLLQIISAESFRPIFNPNIGSKQTAKKITAIAITTTTIRPLTTISATLKSKVSLTKHMPSQPPRSPVKPLSAPTDNTPSDSKDAPVAEALRGDPYYRRAYRRPYYYPSNNLYYNTRVRRRPNPKPYYSPPNYGGYNAPYEDYRYETDFMDQSAYIPKPKKKPPPIEASKDYGGIVDTDIGQFYDSQSATYNVPPMKGYEQPNYYASGAGSTGIESNVGASGIGGGTGIAYSDYSDVDDYRYSTAKPKTNYKNLPSRAPIKAVKTRTKFSSYDDNDYRYSSDTSGYGTSGPEIEEITTDPATLAKYNNVYLPQHTIYQTAPAKPKPKQKPKPIKTTTTTTYAPPVKFSDTSIDVLTKPLGSATFNLNLSPGTVYNQPPQLNYNPIGSSYKPIQPIPIQPPATSYGVPIAPPLNAYTYNNAYQNQFGGYPPSSAQGSNSYINPSQISITNERIPGQFAEPPPLNQVQLSNNGANYNNDQSSYDATPKNNRPSKPRKPNKVNSKRVSTKPPPLNTDEELVEDDRTQNDYTGESYSYFKTMPQPSLPNTYDQEEFHTVKNKRKQPKQTVSEYYERDEKVQTTKKPKKPIEVTLRIPDEDYLDDLVKVVQTTKRPKKKNKQTTSHVLDTEDLRDAYENNSAYYPTKSKKNKSRTRYNQQTTDYDNYDDDTGDDDYENDRISLINSKESERTKSTQDMEANADNDPVEPRYWEKDSSIYKQYGIRARNDNFPVGSSYEVYNSNGFRPIRKDDRSDVFVGSSSNIRSTYVLPPHSDNKYSSGNRISSTLRSITTTTTPTTLYVWDGKEMPRNHKMA